MNELFLGTTLPDIPRIYTALAEWLACLLCLLELKRRITGWRFPVLAAIVLTIQSVFLILTANVDGVLWIVYMVIAAIIMYGFIYISAQIDFLDAGYYTIRAFVVAEFMAALEWQLHCYYYVISRPKNFIPGILILIAVYGVVLLLIHVIYQRLILKDEPLYISHQELLFVVVIGAAIFFMSNLGFVSANTPFSGKYAMEIFNIRTLVDLGGVAIIYAYHIQRINLRAGHDLESMESILHNQYMQYQQSQEAVDLINYKYHDLKHHIIALKAEEDPQKRIEYLNQMEEELKNYEAQNKTGNKVLDTLLATKSLYCQKNHIQITSVVDGKLLDFMNVMDICSIFGNALDNAIEYEEKIKDQEKRMIHLSVFSQKNFLIIHCENYCEDKLRFDRDFPITTKKEAQFHGYGLRSIRHTVHKYGGEVDVSHKENWFHLQILIPMG